MIIFIPNTAQKVNETSRFVKVKKQPRGAYGSRMVISDFNDPSEVIWYHGSVNKFNKFIKSKISSGVIFLSRSVDFAKNMSRGGVVYSCKVEHGKKWWDFRNKEDVYWLLPKAIKRDKSFLEVALEIRINDETWKYELNRYLNLWFKQNYDRVWEAVEPYTSIIQRNGYDGYYIQEDGVLNLGIFKPTLVSIVSLEGDSASINYFK
jgi:hypothetical protein